MLTLDSSTVVTFAALGAADAAVAGGKGANLGELAGAGFPVPPGFVVTAHAHLCAAARAAATRRGGARMSSATESTTPSDPVRRIMAPGVAVVRTGDSLLVVAQELAAGDIGAVVVDSPASPVGVISERDIVAVVANGGDVAAIQAGEIMTGDLVVATPQDSIESVGRMMLDAGVRHVPIRDTGGIVGLVSMRDLLWVLLAPDRDRSGSA